MNNLNDNNSTNPFAYRNWGLLQQTIEKGEVIENVLKFHYKTLNRFNDVLNFENSTELLSWANMTAYQDIIPETYEEIIPLDVSRYEKIHSASKFQVDTLVELTILGQLLYDAFGREAPYSSKRYPSAGGLYPVLPLVLVFQSGAMNNNLSPGCYLFDSSNARLLKICEWNIKEVHKVKKLLNYESDAHPPHCLAYALDIRRATTKYVEKGYRHGLIEVGLMAQSFRESIQQVNTLGERCWSHFIDSALSHICGLNIRLCPIVLVQWFGYKDEN